jgi:hypothetical protein
MLNLYQVDQATLSQLEAEAEVSAVTINKQTMVVLQVYLELHLLEAEEVAHGMANLDDLADQEAEVLNLETEDKETNHLQIHLKEILEEIVIPVEVAEVLANLEVLLEDKVQKTQFHHLEIITLEAEAALTEIMLEVQEAEVKVHLEAKMEAMAEVVEQERITVAAQEVAETVL